MTPGQLFIRIPGGHRLVASQTGGSIPPGLALTLVPLDNPEGDAQWSCTHVLSGLRIGPGFERRADAQRCAEALAPCADWSQPASILLADPNLQPCVAHVLESFLTALDEGVQE